MQLTLFDGQPERSATRQQMALANKIFKSLWPETSGQRLKLRLGFK
jgi:hypothetical protein